MQVDLWLLMVVNYFTLSICCLFFYICCIYISSPLHVAFVVYACDDLELRVRGSRCRGWWREYLALRRGGTCSEWSWPLKTLSSLSLCYLVFCMTGSFVIYVWSVLLYGHKDGWQENKFEMYKVWCIYVYYYLCIMW